jgi:hypothetical protein
VMYSKKAQSHNQKAGALKKEGAPKFWTVTRDSDQWRLWNVSIDYWLLSELFSSR